MTLRIVIAIMLAASAIPSVAQSEPAAGNNSMDISVEAALKRHNIALTQPALLEALRDPDVEVRRLALTELVEQKTMVAIPHIQKAFTTENIPEMRVYFAYALSKLGDSSATEWLKQTCRDGSLPSDQRLEAARHLLSSQRDACLDTVFDALGAHEEGQTNRVWAIWLLIGASNLSEKDLQRSFTALLPLLASPYDSDRAEASSAFDALGLKEAIPYLKQAIAREEHAQQKNQGVLTSMHTALENLKKQTLVTGRVFDAEGHLVPGARVSVWREPLCRNFPEVETEKQGYYRILCHPDGPTEAAFSASKQSPEYPTSKFTHLALEREAKAEAMLVPGSHLTLDFHLGPPDGFLEGYVVDSRTKSGVPNTQITMHRSQTQLQYSSEIPQDGHFVIALPPVPIEITVTAPGYQPWQYKDELEGTDALILPSGKHRMMRIELTPQQ